MSMPTTRRIGHAGAKTSWTLFRVLLALTLIGNAMYYVWSSDVMTQGGNTSRQEVSAQTQTEVRRVSIPTERPTRPTILQPGAFSDIFQPPNTGCWDTRWTWRSAADNVPPPEQIFEGEQTRNNRRHVDSIQFRNSSSEDIIEILVWRERC